MKRFISIIMIMILLVTLMATSIISADMEIGVWNANGPGDMNLRQYDENTLEFNYRFNPSGYNQEIWLIKSVAEENKLFTFNWYHQYHHCWYKAYAKVEAFAKKPDGSEDVVLLHHTVSGPRTVNGIQSIEIYEGYEYGFRIYGEHYDSTNNLSGRFIAFEGENEAPDISVDAGEYIEGLWTNQDVNVTFSATDEHLAMLYIDSDHYTPIGTSAVGTKIVSDTGLTNVTGRAVDLFGLQTIRNYSVAIDKETPYIEINGNEIRTGDTAFLGYIATAYDKAYTYKDDLSGYVPSGELSKELILTDIAEHDGMNQTYNLHLTDCAGNESDITLNYHAISLDDMVNLLEPLALEKVYQRNRTIPIKLQILDETGLPIPMNAENLSFELYMEGVEIERTNDVAEELGLYEFELSEDGLTYKYNLKTKNIQPGEYDIKIYIAGKVYEEGLIGNIPLVITGK